MDCLNDIYLLGHIVSAGSKWSDPERLKALKEYPIQAFQSIALFNRIFWIRCEMGPATLKHYNAALSSSKATIFFRWALLLILVSTLFCCIKPNYPQGDGQNERYNGVI